MWFQWTSSGPLRLSPPGVRAMESASRLVLKPMLRAVSSLSPVRTQSWIPASRATLTADQKTDAPAWLIRCKSRLKSGGSMKPERPPKPRCWKYPEQEGKPPNLRLAGFGNLPALLETFCKDDRGKHHQATSLWHQIKPIRRARPKSPRCEHKTPGVP